MGGKTRLTQADGWCEAARGTRDHYLARCADRNRLVPDNFVDVVGFRSVLSPE